MGDFREIFGKNIRVQDRFDGTSWEVSIVCLASFVAH